MGFFSELFSELFTESIGMSRDELFHIYKDLINDSECNDVDNLISGTKSSNNIKAAVHLLALAKQNSYKAKIIYRERKNKFDDAFTYLGDDSDDFKKVIHDFLE